MHARLVCASVLAAALGFFAAAAQAQNNVLFVFDGSGSMKRQAGAETRIVAAKRAMAQALREMPADTRLGLLMYGHRRAGDCSDIELVSPVGADDAAAINKRIQAVDAKGETPIAESLRQAARSFAALKGQNNAIILVTDGVEECKGDPCAAAREIKAAGLDLKAHVVGFALSDQQRKAVQCIPDITGGRYFEARDAGGLNRALGEVRQQTAQAPPKPVEFNLLSPANGGHVVAAPSAGWAKIISEKDADEIHDGFPAEAIFAFKDQKPATFHTFTMLIASTNGGNPQEFELFAADDLGGPFRSLGVFRAQNMRLLQNPYQRFKLPETTATFLKLRFISAYGSTGAGGYKRVPQIKLIGQMAEAGATGQASQPAAAPDSVNLLSPANGGRVLIAPSAAWGKVISGNDRDEVHDSFPAEAVFGFKDGMAATFTSFRLLIASNASGNPAEFELFAGDSMSGSFRSLGSFKPQNMRLLASPYQEFRVPETTARFLKVRFVSSHGSTGAGGYKRVPQMQMMGKLDAATAMGPLPPPRAGQINLLLPANGGQVLAAPDPEWTKIISGNEREEVSAGFPAEAIFAFKDEKPAVFDSFRLLIASNAAGNPRELELFAGDDLSGEFRSLGVFQPVNARLLQSPYQEFKFPETTAKYLKVKFTSAHGSTGAGGWKRVPQMQLFGTLN
ncbi:MAG: VWA domain-containing protein [Reyranellaceae bacterium]